MIMATEELDRFRSWPLTVLDERRRIIVVRAGQIEHLSELERCNPSPEGTLCLSSGRYGGMTITLRPRVVGQGLTLADVVERWKLEDKRFCVW